MVSSISEEIMLYMLRNSKNVFLLEPEYQRKYMPLGLAKISSYVKSFGGKVSFGRKYLYDSEHDLVCVSSLFTRDSIKVIDAIKRVKKLNPKVEILAGGVYASLMPKHFTESTGVIPFVGYSKSLDLIVPDYSIDWGVKEPWDKFAFAFTTRGCVNHCNYCAVPKLEPSLWINPNWKEHILYDGSKPYVMISDNNLSAQPRSHFEEVAKFIISNKKRVVFDNGFDCKFVDEDFVRAIKGLKFTRVGMRLAFDRIEEDGVFQEAVLRLLKNGVPKSQIMVYVLFNFTDTPKEAFYRMNEVKKLGVRVYPQQFVPLNRTDKKEVYVSKHWTKGLLGAFRFFWLMPGIYGKNEFGTWLVNQNFREICQDDIDCWQLYN